MKNKNGRAISKSEEHGKRKAVYLGAARERGNGVVRLSNRQLDSPNQCSSNPKPIMEADMGAASKEGENVSKTL
jgi:hypothetical protein